MHIEEISKIKNILDTIDEEKLSLEKKKLMLLKCYQKKLASYDESLKVLSDKAENIRRLKYFNRDDIMPIITYLVNLIENKNFYYVETLIPVLWNYNVLDKYSYVYEDNRKIRIAYICQDKIKAKAEIDYFLNILLESSYIKQYEILKQFLLEPKEFYIQINFYSDYIDGKKIEFVNTINENKELYYDDNNIIYQETSTVFRKHYRGNTSNIRDYRYLYIIDFADYLVSKKLEKGSHELTVKEMEGYAKEFAEEYIKNNIAVQRSRKFS